MRKILAGALFVAVMSYLLPWQWLDGWQSVTLWASLYLVAVMFVLALGRAASHEMPTPPRRVPTEDDAAWTLYSKGLDS